jgi:formate/nitrite transporter FocA (FNT family)
MNDNKTEMKSIWYFVGLIMFAIGLIVVAAGIYDLFVPSDGKIVLANLKANIWWGALITITGAIYIYKNKD